MKEESRIPPRDEVERLTPAMRQYREIKGRYPDAILFFHIGDFYETFEQDAELIARELDIALTSRSRGQNGNRVPLAGVPYHAAESYISKLVSKGYKVALCDQVGDPKAAKGIVAREVVRVITPGTAIDAGLLTTAIPRYLMALCPEEKSPDRLGVAFLEVSTGEFFVTVCNSRETLSELATEIARYRPSECIIPRSLAGGVKDFLSAKGVVVTPCDDEVFEHRRAYESLLAHLHVVSLEGFGCEALPAAVSAAGAALHYAKETRRSALGHVTSLSTRISARTMLIDAVSLRNLEILQNIRNGSAENTLFSLLDLTVTSMGNRLLRKYLATPLLSPDEINGRLDAVEYLLRRMPLRHSFRTTIARCADIERISGRIALGTAGPRDLLALAASLECIPEIKSHFRQSGEEIPSALLAGALDAMHEYGPVIDQVRNAIIDEPPATLRNGGVIRSGYDKELDELKRISTGGKDWIAELQQRERERTGIRSLKIGYNRIFGYYIEVTRPNLPLVPKEYERKQTTAGGERFTLPELREKESLIATADERFIAFEGRIYETLIGDLKPHIPGFQETANGLATSDVCAALAEAADKYRYARPVIDESREILIREGRHPVVERSVTGGFVPNDTLIDAVKDQILVITGANMAGKSTYMRGVALICIMAQAGSFVPASYAKIGLVDRIFTRVGAFDDLASGQSTFMVEMIELANILNTMTDRSLVILDEIGRGTSTIDGYSIAKAVLEFLHGKGTSGARTLFATHFHELIGIESELKRVRNYHFAVKESKNDVIFLRKLIPGATDRSYGIHVARLAGIPSRVTARADLILREVADREILPGRKARRYTQLLLMDNGHIPSQEDHPVVRELKTMDLDGITPLQALSRLAEMQKKLKNIDREESG